ncbi:efflux RND transporter periplasmic adaptor subunit [Microvirga sp. Mcv34]|uniref:efflux RND transporter periplasmic adaptor subunit n=1 Tax=Microvirga sp. Mcv34 TaxID=2926016 RepID=UPI002905B6CA|nr:efflux RND transporter periplasmic adaptor subunit [Microvirga sp. Mcv34]
MVIRLLSIGAVAALGIAIGSLVPGVHQTVRSAASLIPLPGFAALQAQEPGPASAKPEAQDEHAEGSTADEHGHAEGGEGGEESKDGLLKLSPDQIAATGIQTAKAEGGTLARRLTAPGSIIPDADRIARVAAKVIGTVAELSKRLGDPVKKGEELAIIESREVAEAKSEYLAAQVNFDLQKTLFEREQSLFQKGISAEQQFLRARTSFTEAQLRLDLARQKLSALGVSESEVAGLSRAPMQGLQRYDIHAPITGRVVERLVDLGAPVGGEGQAKELYVVADLSTVWVELAVPLRDLPSVKEGQTVQITAGGTSERGEGRIIFKSPLLNQETRSARVVAQIDNKAGLWSPGSFVTAAINVEEQAVPLAVPKSALQTVGKDQVVFVRTPEGFEKREVALGRSDGEAAEVVFGLDPGEEIAVTNTFRLKAELGKAEASHAH